MSRNVKKRRQSARYSRLIHASYGSYLLIAAPLDSFSSSLRFHSLTILRPSSKKKSVVLVDWTLRPQDNRVCVEGYREPDGVYWHRYAFSCVCAHSPAFVRA